MQRTCICTQMNRKEGLDAQTFNKLMLFLKSLRNFIIVVLNDKCKIILQNMFSVMFSIQPIFGTFNNRANRKKKCCKGFYLAFTIFDGK